MYEEEFSFFFFKEKNKVEWKKGFIEDQIVSI
jgi:hypothetical protein